MIAHSLNLNFSTRGILPHLHMPQGDSNSREIVATLWDDATPFAVPDEATVFIRFSKPDGTGGMYDKSEEGVEIGCAGNRVTAPIAAQMLTAAGQVLAEINIYETAPDGVSSRLATFPFVIDVIPCVYSDAKIISSDYYNILSSDIAKVLSASVHAPQIGEDETWLIWDSEQSRYVETGVSASGIKGDKGDAGPQGEQGPQGPQGPAGPQGLPGATVSTDGAYGFDVADGHLRLHYTGDAAPDFALDEDGHLILTLDSGQTVDLGKVTADSHDLSAEDIAAIAAQMPVATAEQAGTVKAGTDFDVAEDGTLSLYKALTVIANVVPATVEKGATQTTATVKWATNKTPVSLTVEGESVSPDTTSKELTGLQITAEKTFTVVAADSRGSQTATAVMRFCNGVYTGAAAAPAAVDSAFIRTLTKTLQSGRSRTFTVNAAAGQYIWYACPASYGTPVFNVGGFDGGFSKAATLDYTNPSGYTESYQVWRSDNAGLGQTTVKVS